jgi:hypothetical protein
MSNPAALTTTSSHVGHDRRIFIPSCPLCATDPVGVS